IRLNMTIGKGVNENYLYFTKMTFNTLKEIANEVNNKLKFKIKVTSGFRPKVYNKKIRGASKKSPHQSGSGFDISLRGQSQVFEILKTFDRQGKIILTKESDHFHITVTDPKIRALVK
ncbi:MAG: D-Ala-D-Ala carboxypeptidase family metallohydrolase, partial [Candidatus Gracilibacteria bacterium]|nr:D-Ala-D-Ala carboxypeptidase family metallohydrolase [Candidatus Gracilibacteria bacterium]